MNLPKQAKSWLPNWAIFMWIRVVLHLKATHLVYVNAKASHCNTSTSLLCAAWQFLTNSIIQVEITFKVEDRRTKKVQ